MGNNRSVVNVNGNAVEENDYYPFGMTFAKTEGKEEQPYKYNGKELDTMHGLNLYDYSARYYEPAIGRFTTVDPLAEKYYSISPYAYVANNPVKYIDPDGKRIFFVGGANNDSDGWNYINRFDQIWSKVGLNDFQRINATNGKVGDILFSHMYRETDSYTHTIGSQWSSVSWQSFSYDNEQYKKALDDIVSSLISNPLQDGEQLNLAGYSYGAVLQAHLAIGLIDVGYEVHNLILIGSPTSNNSQLMKTLKSLEKKGKIGKIIRFDIGNDYLSNPESQIQFLRGAVQSAPIIGSGDEALHFDFARQGKDTDERIKDLGKQLKGYGVR